MTSIILPQNITSIGEYAFAFCKNLTTVSIGKSVKSIGNSAFYGCSGLKTVTSYMKNPPSIGDRVFQYYDEEKGDYAFTAATLVVPAGTKAKYQATNGWKNFTEIVEMEASDTMGDVNGDKSVNAKDIVAIADIIATGGYDDAADLNGDNVVNIADIIMLVNMIESSANSE